MAEFDLEMRTRGGIFLNIELCKNWKELVSKINFQDYKSKLEAYSNDMAKFSGLDKATIRWDEEGWGLQHVDVRRGNATYLALQRGDPPKYIPHNIDTPEQAFTLMATVLKYVHEIRLTNSTADDLHLDWDIWPIGIDNYKELFIKIDMHKQLKSIASHLGKGLRNFIEKCAPFAEEGYTDLKEVKYNWDDELGLRSVEAIPGRNGSSLNLTKDAVGNFYYLSHNIYKPIQAVALIGAVSKYIEYAKQIQKEKLKLPAF